MVGLVIANSPGSGNKQPILNKLAGPDIAKRLRTAGADPDSVGPRTLHEIGNQAADEIERLRAELAKADAIIFLIDANMRGPGGLPIPLSDVKKCLNRHKMRVNEHRPDDAGTA
jgi:hypothetical protein